MNSLQPHGIKKQNTGGLVGLCPIQDTITQPTTPCGVLVVFSGGQKYAYSLGFSEILLGPMINILAIFGTDAHFFGNFDPPMRTFWQFSWVNNQEGRAQNRDGTRSLE